MIEIVKDWMGSLISISFLVILVKLIVPNSNIKKYIYSLLGIITAIVVFKPLINNSNLENILLDATKNIDFKSNSYKYTDISNYEEINNNNIKEAFKEKLESSIIKLIQENTNNKKDNISVDVEITKEYNIEKVVINCEDTNKEEILNLVSANYDIPKEIIIIN